MRHKGLGRQNHQRIQGIKWLKKRKPARQFDKYRVNSEYASRSFYQRYFSAVQPIDFEESKKVAKQGGNVAKVAMKELESKTAKK